MRKIHKIDPSIFGWILGLTELQEIFLSDFFGSNSLMTRHGDWHRDFLIIHSVVRGLYICYNQNIISRTKKSDLYLLSSDLHDWSLWQIDNLKSPSTVVCYLGHHNQRNLSQLVVDDRQFCSPTLKCSVHRNDRVLITNVIVILILTTLETPWRFKIVALREIVSLRECQRDSVTLA